MVKRRWRFRVMAGVVITGLAAGTAVTSGQGGGGNPLAALQQQIDALAQQVANLSNGTPVQGGAESDLFVIRGTIGGGGGALAGAGFTVSTNFTLPCGSNLYPEYHVTFNQPFTSTPSVVVSARDNLFSPFGDIQNRPVYTAAVYGVPGGGDGFSVRIKTDAFSVTCFGSYNWDFIAIGPR